MSVIVTGDDTDLPVTLKKDGKVFTVDAGATVKTALISVDHKKTFIAAVVSSNATTGADWANSLIIVEFSGADTVLIPLRDAKPIEALIEIQVDDGGKKKTWFVRVEVQKGTIS